MINLLPPAIKKSNQYARKNITLLQYAIVIVLVSASLIVTLFYGKTVISQNEKDINKSIQNSETKIESLGDVTEEAANIKKNIEVISNILSREIRFSELLTEIGSVLPNGSVLINLAVSDERDQPLVLDTQVLDEETAAIFRENLSESELFSSADIISISRTGDPDTIYSFNARFQAFFATKEQKAEVKETQ